MKIVCELCPKSCIIDEGEAGNCRIRCNIDGELKAVTYGFPVAVHLDPIEKKPLFHFYPSSKILSLATVGCNLHCKNCQNWEISQAKPDEVDAYELMPQKLIDLSLKLNSPSIAYTYTEPLVYYEYTLDCSILAHERGIKNVLVTAGYLNKEPLRKLLPYIDGVTLDIKAFSDEFYREICDARLKPVLNNLELIKSMNVWLEVSNLIIPTLNDSDKMLRDLIDWIYTHLGPETPLHFLRFFPRYRMTNLPPTPSETLEKARNMALERGMYYVYIGNLSSKTGENTYCPGCNQILIERKGYKILKNNIINGKCSKCGRIIEGLFE